MAELPSSRDSLLVRNTDTTRLRLSGDIVRAKQYIGVAQTYMGWLRNTIALGGINHGARHLRLADGVVIKMLWDGVLNIIDIFVPDVVSTGCQPRPAPLLNGFGAYPEWASGAGFGDRLGDKPKVAILPTYDDKDQMIYVVLFYDESHSPDGKGRFYNLWEDGCGGEAPWYDDLLYANVDWKGAYVDGLPTRQINWAGYSGRHYYPIYFPRKDASGLVTYTGTQTPFQRNLFQYGLNRARVPSGYVVAGAALFGLDVGGESVTHVACACYPTNQFTPLTIMYRVYDGELTDLLYDAETAPTGWKIIHTMGDDADSVHVGEPWFWNGDGTELAAVMQHNHPSAGQIPNVVRLTVDWANLSVSRSIDDQYAIEGELVAAPEVHTQTTVPKPTTLLSETTCDDDPVPAETGIWRYEEHFDDLYTLPSGETKTFLAVAADWKDGVLVYGHYLTTTTAQRHRRVTQDIIQDGSYITNGFTNYPHNATEEATTVEASVYDVVTTERLVSAALDLDMEVRRSERRLLFDRLTYITVALDFFKSQCTGNPDPPNITVEDSGTHREEDRNSILLYADLRHAVGAIFTVRTAQPDQGNNTALVQKSGIQMIFDSTLYRRTYETLIYTPAGVEKIIGHDESNTTTQYDAWDDSLPQSTTNTIYHPEDLFSSGFGNSIWNALSALALIKPAALFDSKGKTRLLSSVTYGLVNNTSPLVVGTLYYNTLTGADPAVLVKIDNQINPRFVSVGLL